MSTPRNLNVTCCNDCPFNVNSNGPVASKNMCNLAWRVIHTDKATFPDWCPLTKGNVVVNLITK